METRKSKAEFSEQWQKKMEQRLGKEKIKKKKRPTNQ